MVGKTKKELNLKYNIFFEKLGYKDDNFSMLPSPWNVWHFKNPAKQSRYVLFSGQPIFMIPGTSRAKIHIFSEDGKELSVYEFSTGWRINLYSAKLSFNKLLGTQVIVLSTGPVINGRDVAKQYFSFEGDTLRFVRMEDNKGEALKNNYHYPNHTLGTGINQTKEQWVTDLKSKSPTRILSALVYIGGEHMDPNRPEKDVSTESVKEAKIAESLKQDQQVKELINTYKSSKINWVRDAVKLINK